MSLPTPEPDDSKIPSDTVPEIDLDEVAEVPAPGSGIKPPLSRTPAHDPDKVRAFLAYGLAAAAALAVVLVLVGWLVGGRDISEALPVVSLLTTLAASGIAFYFGSER